MLFQEDNVEALVVSIILHGMHIAIVNVYVPPYATFPNILNIIEKSLCNISSGKPIVTVHVNMHQSSNRTKTLKYIFIATTSISF